ncbi:zinc ribbon domain-containing protein [Litorivivens sp.]|uniref:zinc ribbon domain-containing protein n=1 Tax=Litorivivens sp. TaxID=2020868 RepID=UPI003564DE83
MFTAQSSQSLEPPTNPERFGSSCGEISDSARKGAKGLGLREWVCSCCGSELDRNQNAALNILRLGHQALALK